MSDLSIRPARLLTAFGTVLYIDTASRELRHGSIEGSPANVYLVPREDLSDQYIRCLLAFSVNEILEGIIRRPDHSLGIVQAFPDGLSTNPTLFEFVPLERGLFTLQSDQFFLSASPDGQVKISATVCSTWELFVASENWCTEIGVASDIKDSSTGPNFDTKTIRSYIVHPLIRARTCRQPKALKIAAYGYTRWSHGRVYYDLSKHLHERGYIFDLVDWQMSHRDYIDQLIDYYDFFITALDGASALVDVYKIPCERIIALSHHELDIRMLIEQKGVEIFDKFAGYGVVSEFVYSASLMRGVARHPMVASLGVNYSEFYSDISTRLATVGYASSMSTKTYDIEWKRGELAEAATRAAGLEFKVAGWTGNQISFHEMPEFYRSIDAVLVSSVSESGPLTVLEGAAAGRLVIGTPVGHFPVKAYQGGGILAPVEPEKFISFTSSTLRYYRDNPSAYVDKCLAIQEAAKKFDWSNSIGEWIDLIETANAKG